MRGGRTHGPHRKGFTLIEMIVLIIIMAVLSATAVPAYSRLRDRAVFQVRVNQLVSFLANARAQAIDLKTRVEMRFDPQTDTFTVRGESAFDSADMPTDLAESAESATVLYERSLTLPDDYRIVDYTVFGPEAVFGNLASSQETVTYFREDGTCDGVRFMLVRNTGDAAVVTLWPTTGTVDVEPPSTD